ncbi:MAG: biotin--[acetyl-CoA-carboxylase] ligase [Nitrospirae bacterium]|nr:biotin--[acetyl-CoA-carboxylase] ligase [Nitrospirota bacterium]
MPHPADTVLSLLHKHKDACVSGQALAQKLGVTRAAVWKAIEALRADGYSIESMPAKGYRLVSIPDRLGEREITLGLNTRVLGRTVHALDSVDSTNSYASRLAVDGAPDGTLVVSESQTAGRGRLGRSWVSPPGVNIYLSMLLRPQMPPQDAPFITLAASVALARTLKDGYKLDAAIKWPNDVLLSGRKASGILTEMSSEPDRIRHVVLGVGIDVNMKPSEFPDDIRAQSTSVMAELGRSVNRAELLCRFLEEFEPVYELLVGGAGASVLDLWRGLSCTLGRRIVVKTLRGELTGLARDIDASGGLILELDGGTTQTVTSGDVGFV